MSDIATQQEIAAPAVVELPGSKPLRRPAHERFARARSMLLPLVEAYRQAGLGGENYVTDRGNGAKLDRRQDIRARVAYLTQQPEDVLKQKRERLEAALWRIHDTDFTEFYETVEIDELDEDGEPTGRKHKQQWLRPFSELTEDQRHLVQGLKYTEKGRPILELPVKMQANIELRKLLGLGAVERDATDTEFGRMSDGEVFATIAREAKELGIVVEFTFRANGAAA